MFRRGVVPQLATAELEILADLLRRDCPDLQQGHNCYPAYKAPSQLAYGSRDNERPVLCGCPLVLPRARAGRAPTVAEADRAFRELCDAADRAFPGEAAACRRFINWWDDAPRRAAVRELLAEVEAALADRRAGRCA